MQILEYFKPARYSVSVLLGLVFSCLVATVSAETELLMIEEPGCVYCARFNQEIAPAYPKTTEGSQAPLRRLLIADSWPADLQAVEPARFTPTFILVRDGQEIDRLAGYPGDEHFWYLLGQMLDKL